MAAILRASVSRAIVGFMPFSSRVEVLERSGPHAGRDGGSFEQSFQIMVVVLVETPDGEQFLGASQLSFDITVFRTGTSLQCQPAVGP